MKVVKEFSISLVNKPGVLAGILKALGRAKVDGLAMTISDSADLGVLRLVVVQTDVAEKVLKQLNLPMTCNDVLQIELDNKSGALADVVEKLAKAMKVLGAEKTHKDGTALRRSQGSRKF